MDHFYFYAIILFVLINYTNFIINWRSGGRKKNTPPSPPTLPIFGNLHQLGQLPHRALWELSMKHGPLMLLHFGTKPVLVVSSTEAAKEILKTHDLSFADRPDILTSAGKLTYGLKDVACSLYNERWRKLKSIFVQHLLSSERVRSFDSIRDAEITILIEKIKKNSCSVNLTDIFMAMSYDLICRAALGQKYSETEYGKKFMEVMSDGLIMKLFVNFTIGELIPGLGWINWLNGYNATVDQCLEKADEILDAVVKDHLNRGLREGSNGSFLDILLGIYNDNNTRGVSIDMSNVKALLLDIFVAGTDTSAATLKWLMTELIRHSQVMKKLQEEIRGIMKDKHQITDDDLHKMHYLKAVIKETFRLHPPGALYGHAAREYVNLMGYDIQPKTIVLINAWAIGRDPAYWHDPEKFMPERFLDSSVDFRGLDIQLIPFGAGRRMCPGIGFAVAVIEHTLANLMLRFDWALPKGANGEDLDVIERPGLTTGRKYPLVVEATKYQFCYF